MVLSFRDSKNRDAAIRYFYSDSSLQELSPASNDALDANQTLLASESFDQAELAGLSGGPVARSASIVPTRFSGNLAIRLDLDEELATREAFASLLNNEHPESHLKLTPRTRQIMGLDATFSTPKGVSLLWANGDSRLPDALTDAVSRTLKEELEPLAQTRVRKGRVAENRTTGELIWCGFTHEASRPVRVKGLGKISDPHLHQHAFIHNLTYDDTEGTYKAAKFRAVREHAEYLQEAFESHLAASVKELGYAITPRGKLWDIKGISDRLLNEFSTRTRQIDAHSKHFDMSPAAKGRLAKATRNVKDDISWRDSFDLRAGKEAEKLTELTQEAIEASKTIERPTEQRAKKDAQTALQKATGSLLSMWGEIKQHKLLAEALRLGRGLFRPEHLDTSGLDKEAPDDLLRRVVTTPKYKRDKDRLLELYRASIGVHEPLGSSQQPGHRLELELQSGVDHVCETRDQVSYKPETREDRSAAFKEKLFKQLREDIKNVVIDGASTDSIRNRWRSRKADVIVVDNAQNVPIRPMIRLLEGGARLVLLESEKASCGALKILKDEGGLLSCSRRLEFNFVPQVESPAITGVSAPALYRRSELSPDDRSGRDIAIGDMVQARATLGAVRRGELLTVAQGPSGRKSYVKSDGRVVNKMPKGSFDVLHKEEIRLNEGDTVQAMREVPGMQRGELARVKGLCPQMRTATLSRGQVVKLDEGALTIHKRYEPGKSEVEKGLSKGVDLEKSKEREVEI